MMRTPSYTELLEDLNDDPRFAQAVAAIDAASAAVDTANRAWREGASDRATLLAAQAHLRARIHEAGVLYVSIARELDRRDWPGRMRNEEQETRREETT